MLIATLGTLPFIATLWLLAWVGTAMVKESGGKIAAALKGPGLQPPMMSGSPARLRSAINAKPLSYATVEWRAAA